MNDIIRPPRQPQQQPELPREPARPGTPGQGSGASSVSPHPTPLLEVHELPELPALAESPKKRRSAKKAIIILAAIIAGALIATVGAAIFWYNSASKPVSGDTSRTPITVVEGSTPAQIGQLLEEKGVIRSQFAFDIHTRLSGDRNMLQAGTYRLSPSESLQEVVAHLVSGNVDEFTLTFYPGATLTDPTDTPENKKTDVQTVLRRAGYSDTEILAAFKKHYDHPLLVGKPANADLEGYVYGETYNFSSNASVEQILERTFDEYYEALQKSNLIPAFKKQGLTLYQAITLASIIQREVPNPTDQKQVAQIFLKRYREDMPLGSDITAYYGADMIGERRTVAVDTPYNTRIHKGLPPGPIASPGLTALEAVAHPAAGDYVYFLSGDDDVTYYARTSDEHDANIREHCQIKCAME